MNTDSSKEGSYLGITVVTLMVVFLWGVVPALAQITRWPGGITTALVNAFSALAILVAMTATGSLKVFRQMKGRWFDFVKLGFWWPLVYSVAFFHAIYASGNGSFVSIMNAMWPLAAMYFVKRNGYHITTQTFVVVLIACAIAGAVLVNENTLTDIGLPLLLGGLAAALQGYFNAETKNDDKYPMSWDMALMLTLIGALMAMFGGALVALTTEVYLPLLTFEGLRNLAIIGIFSNGIGFTLFLVANQMTGKNDNKSGLFYVLMALVLIVQVLLADLQLGQISGWHLGAGVALLFSLVMYRVLYPPKKQESDMEQGS